MSKSAKEVFDSKMGGCPVAGKRKGRRGNYLPAPGVCGWSVDGECQAAGGVDVRNLTECAKPKKRGTRASKPKGAPLFGIVNDG